MQSHHPQIAWVEQTLQTGQCFASVIHRQRPYSRSSLYSSNPPFGSLVSLPLRDAGPSSQLSPQHRQNVVDLCDELQPSCHALARPMASRWR